MLSGEAQGKILTLTALHRDFGNKNIFYARSKTLFCAINITQGAKQ